MKGDLCFDVCANLGDRTEAFVRLGGHVVAIEPQRLLHGATEEEIPQLEKLNRTCRLMHGLCLARSHILLHRY